MTTKTKTKHPGITKITYAHGEIRYRLIISVGKIPGLKPGTWKEVQECHTTRTLAEALKKQAEIRDARDKGKFVKRDNVTFDELCSRWLDSRHDVREVTVTGYRHDLKAPREQLGQKRVQDLTRADVDAMIKSFERRKLSHRTIVGTLGRVHQVLAYGISSGLLSIKVPASVKAPRKQHSQAVVDTRPKAEVTTQLSQQATSGTGFGLAVGMRGILALWRNTARLLNAYAAQVLQVA